MFGSSVNAAKSCQHVLEVGDSKGNGEYWIDPEGNGNPLKVFCDMNTDGGGSVIIFSVFFFVVVVLLFCLNLFFYYCYYC